MKKAPLFALIGCAGFVAPRHLQAIRDVGGELVAALDPHDSVGILDQFFPRAAYFREPERFERHLEMLRLDGRGADWVSICSPNFLHDAHCRLALRCGANAICEKPLVLHELHLAALEACQGETGGEVYTVLQLREREGIRGMLEMTVPGGADGVLEYTAPRGSWYDYSWKGDPAKSGGVAANIGIHLFDLLIYAFGEPLGVQVSEWRARTAGGQLWFAGGRSVRWRLSTEMEPPVRRLTCGDMQVDLSRGFEDLHTAVYERTLAGNGWGIGSARPAIRLLERLRRLAECPHVPGVHEAYVGC